MITILIEFICESYYMYNYNESTSEGARILFLDAGTKIRVCAGSIC